MKSVVQEASTIGKAIEQGWKTAGEPRDFSIKVLEIPEHNFLGFTTRSAKVAIVFDENAPREASPRERREPRPRGERAPRERGPRSREPRRSDRGGYDRTSSERTPSDRTPSERTSSERGGRDRFSRGGGPREDREYGRSEGRGRERRDRFRDRDERDGQREFGRSPYRSSRPPVTEVTDEAQIEALDEKILRGEMPGLNATPEPIVQSPAPQAMAPVEEPMEGPEEGDAEGAEKQIGQWDAELTESAKKWLTETLRLMGMADITFSLEPQNFHLRITLNKALIEDETKERHLFASLATLMMASLKKEFRKALRGHKIVIVHG